MATNEVIFFFISILVLMMFCKYKRGQAPLLSSKENFQDVQYFKAIMENKCNVCGNAVQLVSNCYLEDS